MRDWFPMMVTSLLLLFWIEIVIAQRYPYTVELPPRKTNQWDVWKERNISFTIPFQVLVLSTWRGQTDFCGGAVLDDEHIITAASCVVRPHSQWLLKVRIALAYVNNTNAPIPTYHVVREIFYQKKQREFIEGDIVILQVDKAMMFNGKTVQPFPFQKEKRYRSKQCYLLGWSESKKPRLSGRSLEVAPLGSLPSLHLVSRHRCVGQGSSHRPPRDLVCLGRPRWLRDTCQEAVGAPVVCGGRLVALAIGARGCGRFSYALYADMSYYSEWVALALSAAADREDLQHNDASERQRLREEPPRR